MTNKKLVVNGRPLEAAPFLHVPFISEDCLREGLRSALSNKILNTQL